MSQHCRANPCCGDRPCSGIPLPQHASGLPSHNKSVNTAIPPSPVDQLELSPAATDILAERRRQVEVEDFDASHDDMATKGQLATAAACYAFQAGARGRMFPGDPQPIGIWPWDRAWWKPTGDHRRNLIKAGALIIAEIERLDRLSQNQSMEQQS